VEANGFQGALIQDMQTDDELAKVRCVPVFTEKDKVTRAWMLTAFFERGQVYLAEGMTHVRDHLLAFPSGRYKDLFDAIDFAITIAFSGMGKQRDKEPGLM